jgi:hypothetical protein
MTQRKAAKGPKLGSIIVPITTFAPEPVEILKEIKVVVQNDEDEYIATFFDANVNAGGCNQVEAFENLKDLILSRYDYLNSQPPEKLGPALAKQISVLREFIRRK